MIEIRINGRYPSLNEYVGASRSNRKYGNAFVQKHEKDIIRQLKEQKVRPLKTPIRIAYKYYGPNKRRDKDNIAGFFHKVFQDSLVKSGLLPDDGWKEIAGFRDDFGIDPHPHIDIMIYEKVKQ